MPRLSQHLCAGFINNRSLKRLNLNSNKVHTAHTRLHTYARTCMTMRAHTPRTPPSTPPLQITEIGGNLLAATFTNTTHLEELCVAWNNLDLAAAVILERVRVVVVVMVIVAVVMLMVVMVTVVLAMVVVVVVMSMMVMVVVMSMVVMGSEGQYRRRK